jgi:cysteine-rich repeat protein
LKDASFDCPLPGLACNDCGDGVVQGIERCDDRNQLAGDGCSADCLRIDANFNCFADGTCARCGDGVRQPGEACDDGADATVSPDGLVYDPARRSFAGHKQVSSQKAIELCLDGSVIDPNNTTAGQYGTIFRANGTTQAVSASYVAPPRPVSDGTLLEAAYDPFTGHFLFLSKQGTSVRLAQVPLCTLQSCPAGSYFQPGTDDIALFQTNLSGVGGAEGLTVGEDGNLYVTDDVAKRVAVFPRRRDGSNNIVIPNCRTAPEANCTSFVTSPDVVQGFSAPTTDVLDAIFTVPGEEMVGIFNQFVGATSYTGLDAESGTPVTSSEYFTFYEPALTADPPLYGRSQLFQLGGLGRTYTKYAQSAETATDGGSFLVCPHAPTDRCGFVDSFVYAANLGGGVTDSATVRVLVRCVCGDGALDANEQCDLGNANGPLPARCSASCALNVVCGDGITDPGEQCDDHDTSSGDGCSARCTLESVCGDGAQEGVEQCDDGNLSSGDACNPNCRLPMCGDSNVDVQTPFLEQCDDGLNNSNVGGATCSTLCTINARCGNAKIEPGERCDDGNVLSGDGCSSSCQVEGQCGNGSVDGAEECDPANAQSQCGGHACTSICLCSNYCGDGRLGGQEQCDDGNTTAGDRCRADCTAELCGDGVPDTGEQCDDGNDDPTDKCTNGCLVVAICGDGVLDPGEACDDHNRVSGDGCSSTCRAEALSGSCGNGSIERGEQCDDGNLTAGDGCSAVCRLEGGVCGDGTLNLGEQCDDGGKASGDGCDGSCRFEGCGDGVQVLDEECDDGNRTAGDGCDESCSIEFVLG